MAGLERGVRPVATIDGHHLVDVFDASQLAVGQGLGERAEEKCFDSIGWRCGLMRELFAAARHTGHYREGAERMERSTSREVVACGSDELKGESVAGSAPGGRGWSGVR